MEHNSGLIAGPYCTLFLAWQQGWDKKALMDICCRDGFCDGMLFFLDWKPKLNLCFSSRVLLYLQLAFQITQQNDVSFFRALFIKP